MRGRLLVLGALFAYAPAGYAAESEAWYPVASPTTANLARIRFAEDGTGFISGAQGSMLRRFPGGQWHVLPFPFGAPPLGTLAPIDSDEVWVTGGVAGRFYHFKQGQWSSEQTDPEFYCQSIDFVRPNLGYAVGLFGALFRYDGEHWERVDSPAWTRDRDNHLDGVVAYAEDDVWAGGSRLLLHFDGKAWQRMPLPQGASGGSVRRAGDALAIINGPVVLRRDLIWETVSPLRPESIAMSSTGMLWGIILGNQPRSLVRLFPPGDELSLLDRHIVGIASAPDGLWAVAERGTILHLEPRTLPALEDTTFEAGAGVQARSAMALFVDLDGASPRDLLLARPFGRNSFLRSEGPDGFRSQSLVTPSISQLPDAGAIDVADIDGDGRTDLVMRPLGRPNRRPIHLLRNLDGFRFWDATEDLPLLEAEDEVYSGNVTIGDLDSDGDLDIYESRFLSEIGGFTVPNVVYRNDGFGHIKRQVLAEHDGGAALSWGRNACIADFTGDGRADLLSVNAWGAGNSFYIQDSRGQLIDATQESGIQGGFQDNHFAVSGDIDNDGDLDALVLAMAQFGPSRLYRNDGRGHFRDITTESGLADVFTSAARAEFADMDLDGDVDLVLSGALSREMLDIRAGRLRLLVNDGLGHFTDVTIKASVDISAQDVIADDMDDDGDIDLYVVRPGDSNRLLSSEPPKAGFLRVTLSSPAPNRVAIGTRISVFRQDGSLVGFRETNVRHPIAYFGLGQEALVDVEVRFPSGRVVWRRAVLPNSMLDVLEGSRIEMWARNAWFFLAHRWSWTTPTHVAISWGVLVTWLAGLFRLARRLGARTWLRRLPVLGGLGALYGVLEVAYLPLVPVSAVARVLPTAMLFGSGLLLLGVDRFWTRRRHARFVGPYELLSEIGQGGMGIVYRARDKSRPTRSVVALKVLRPGRVEDATHLKRFFREADVGVRLHHPGIVTVYGCGECRVWDGEAWRRTAYLAMEHIEGTSLAALLADTERLPVVRVVEIIRDAALALAAAHEAGVLHRDIKPDNLLLSRAGVVKIVDFGIATIARAPSLTEAGFLVGTLAYLPPERAAGRTEDARGDLYSLGVVLFEALCGERPFEHASGDTASLLAAILCEPARLPVSSTSALPPRLHALMLALLAKDPADRPATATAVAEELHHLLLALRGESAISAISPIPTTFIPANAEPDVARASTAPPSTQEIPSRAAQVAERVTEDFPMPLNGKTAGE